MKDTSAKRVASRVLYAMAYNRDTFKDRVREHITGAYLEYYKATLAKKNGYTKWVTHWETEVQTLLDRNLIAVLFHDVRGFKDRRKAFAEVSAALKAKDGSFRAAAEKVIRRDFEVRRLAIPLDDEDMAQFWLRVEQAADIGFTRATT